MKVKLKNLGVKAISTGPLVAKERSKQVIRYPEVTLNSQQIAGLKDVEAGQKCMLTFEAEVKGFRTPEEWDTRDGLKPTDMVVTFKLVKGSYGMKDAAEKKEHGYKSINDASFGARKEMMK